jgi:ATP-dependent Clp endopeptidase proteolytic subunit ClpP
MSGASGMGGASGETRAWGPWVVVLALGVVIAQLAIVAALGVWAVRTLEDMPGLAETVLDVAADSFTEAGFFMPEEDLDDPLLDHRIIVLTEGINERTARGVVRKLVYLDAEDSEAPIDLYISTQGGWFDSAFAVIDAIELISAPVNTIGVGGCYSAGALILMSGTGHRSATPNTLISLHANFFEDGSPDSLGALERGRVEGIMRSKAKLPDAWLPFEDDISYYLTAEDAVELAIIDAIHRPAEQRSDGSAKGSLD